jgi:tetratricopeptide (TPR) repeat protein
LLQFKKVFNAMFSKVRPSRIPLSFICWALAALLAWCWVVWHGTRLIAADLTVSAARQQIETWAVKDIKWTPSQWTAAQGDVRSALAIFPQDPVLMDTLATLYMVRGSELWDNEEERQKSYQQARKQLELSLKERPRHAPTWANLALTLYALGLPSNEVYNAWDAALRYGRNEPPVQDTLFDVALITWEEAPNSARDWVISRFQKASLKEREALLLVSEQYGRSGLLLASEPQIP